MFDLEEHYSVDDVNELFKQFYESVVNNLKKKLRDLEETTREELLKLLPTGTVSDYFLNLLEQYIQEVHDPVIKQYEQLLDDNQKVIKNTGGYFHCKKINEIIKQLRDEIYVHQTKIYEYSQENLNKWLIDLSEYKNSFFNSVAEKTIKFDPKEDDELNLDKEVVMSAIREEIKNKRNRHRMWINILVAFFLTFSINFSINGNSLINELLLVSTILLFPIIIIYNVYRVIEYDEAIRSLHGFSFNRSRLNYVEVSDLYNNLLESYLYKDTLRNWFILGFIIVISGWTDLLIDYWRIILNLEFNQLIIRSNIFEIIIFIFILLILIRQVIHYLKDVYYIWQENKIRISYFQLLGGFINFKQFLEIQPEKNIKGSPLLIAKSEVRDLFSSILMEGYFNNSDLDIESSIEFPNNKGS